MTSHEELLKDLDVALQVEPSRAFAEGVRARVIRSRVQTRRMWWSLAAAASVGLVSLGMWRPWAKTLPAGTAVPVVASVTPAEPVTTPETVVSSDLPAPVQPAAPRVTSAARSVMVSSEPRLEVITNQGAVLRELWAQVRPGAMVEVAAEDLVPVPARQENPLTPIVVEPIVATPIVVSGIEREPGRVGATPVIRRMQATKETR